MLLPPVLQLSRVRLTIIWLQPMKVNAFERAFVEACANRFPSRATAHECARMSVSVSTQSGSSNQELSPQAVRCVAQEFLMSLFPGLLNDFLEVSQGSKRLVGVLGWTRNKMHGHPTQDSLDFVATSCRFLHDDSDCNMITRWTVLSGCQKHGNRRENHAPLAQVHQ